MQKCLKSAVNWIRKFNALVPLDNFKYKDLTDLEKLQGYLVKHEVSKVYPISYCEHPNHEGYYQASDASYYKVSDAVKLHNTLPYIVAQWEYLSFLPSLGIEEGTEIYNFLKELYICSGNLAQLKYLEAKKGERDAIIVAKDLLCNFTYMLQTAV